MTWCELCDLDRMMCMHGLADRQNASERTADLLISPRGMAHFDGCPHKGDDPDYEKWGRVSEPLAWQRLGNGDHIVTADSRGRLLTAASRCSDCVAHGPW